jgi:hypothetical protein
MNGSLDVCESGSARTETLEDTMRGPEPLSLIVTAYPILVAVMVGDVVMAIGGPGWYFLTDRCMLLFHRRSRQPQDDGVEKIVLINQLRNEIVPPTSQILRLSLWESIGSHRDYRNP